MAGAFAVGCQYEVGDGALLGRLRGAIGVVEGWEGVVGEVASGWLGLLVKGGTLGWGVEIWGDSGRLRGREGLAGVSSSWVGGMECVIGRFRNREGGRRKRAGCEDEKGGFAWGVVWLAVVLGQISCLYCFRGGGCGSLGLMGWESGSERLW